MFRAIPTPAALLANVMRTQTVDRRERARTTSVSTPAPSPAAQGQSAQWRTMWPSADVPAEPPEIHSETVDDLPVMRSALRVVPTLIAR